MSEINTKITVDTQELEEYELESNGGYVGKVHTEVYALRALINYWKAERSAKGL